MTPPIKVIQENNEDIHPQTEVNAIVGLDQYILNKLYPIGSIYFTTNDVNPSTLFGGTWSKFAEGRTILGANSSYPAGSTGGEATHKLSINEMPSHNHTFSGSSGTTNSTGSHSHTISNITIWNNNGYWQSNGNPYNHSDSDSKSTSSAGNHSHTFTPSGTISSVGGGGGTQQSPALYRYLHLDKDGIRTYGRCC